MRSRLLPVFVAVALIEAVAFAWARLWAGIFQGDPLFGLDLGAYREGALRLIATGSPYHEALAAGPIENRIENVPIAYLYAPPIAQAYVPFVTIDPDLIAAVWAIAQVVALVVLLPMVYRRYGGGASLTSTLGVLFVAVLFQPLDMALYIGNLSGWIAIGVAVMLLGPSMAAGVAAAILAVAKLTASVLLVPAMVRRESRLAACLAAAALTAVSILLAPFAWTQWIHLLPNILRFPAAGSDSNLAPAAVLGALGFPAAGSVLGLAVAVVAVGATVVLAARGSWAGSVAAAAAALVFAPSTIWDHYLAVLLPLIIASWPRSDRRIRASFVFFLILSASGWLGAEGLLPVRTIYMAATLAAAVSATVWLAGRESVVASRQTALT